MFLFKFLICLHLVYIAFANYVPYLVRISENIRVPRGCTGTLLANKWALTAYSCVRNTQANQLQVCPVVPGGNPYTCRPIRDVSAMKRVEALALIEVELPFTHHDHVSMVRLPRGCRSSSFDPPKQCKMSMNMAQFASFRRTQQDGYDTNEFNVTLEQPATVQCKEIKRWVVKEWGYTPSESCQYEHGMPLVCGEYLSGVLLQDPELEKDCKEDDLYFYNVYLVADKLRKVVVELVDFMDNSGGATPTPTPRGKDHLSGSWSHNNTGSHHHLLHAECATISFLVLMLL